MHNTEQVPIELDISAIEEYAIIIIISRQLSTCSNVFSTHSPAHCMTFQSSKIRGGGKTK